MNAITHEDGFPTTPPPDPPSSPRLIVAPEALCRAKVTMARQCLADAARAIIRAQEHQAAGRRDDMAFEMSEAERCIRHARSWAESTD